MSSVPLRAQPTDGLVSVIVPVFNEPETVAEVVNRLLALPCVSQVVAVDDGSTRGEDRLAALSDERLLVVRHSRNLGKGAAIRTGLRHATGEVVVIQDADLEYAPEEIPGLIVPLVTGEADAVYGSRFAGQAPASLPRSRLLANRLLTWLSNRATGLSLSDMETGHKAFRASLLDGVTLREDRFGVEPEITAKIARRGARVIELSVSYAPRSYAEGKKIGFGDGVRALWCIYRYSWLA